MPQTRKQKNVVKRWVKALKSGEYRQGTGFLITQGRAFDRFCCLGVLCDMAVRANVIAPPKYPNMFDGHYTISRCHQYLPKAVMSWAGIRTDNGEFAETSLTLMNDSGSSFTKIAKVIESKPRGLFVE